MNDGHTGIRNEQMNQANSQNFQLVFSSLKHSNGKIDFVIHAKSATYGYSGLQPHAFLKGIGLRSYKGACQFYGDSCHCAIVATADTDLVGIQNYRRVHMLHEQFKTFARRIDRLYELRREESRILRAIGLKPSFEPLLTGTQNLHIEEGEEPLWAHDVKYEQLLALEDQEASLMERVHDLRGFLPLVYADGTALEEAVLKALRYMGLKAEPTERGFTADVLA